MTVVFEAEWDFLLLQARSFAAYLTEEQVDAIVVIDNTRRGIREASRANLLASYGAVGNRVTVLRPSDLGGIPRTTGWYAQQLLKMQAAAAVRTSASVVLDAKNHLIRPFYAEHFAADDGRLRSSFEDFRGHVLRANVERTLRFFGLDPVAMLHEFHPTITPIALDTNAVRALLATVATIAKAPFAQAFIRERLVEFPAYWASLLMHSGRIEEIHSFDQPVSITLWPRAASEGRTREVLQAAHEGESSWFSVHRRSLKTMTSEDAGLVAEFWHRHGLFATIEDGRSYIEGAKSTIRREDRRQRIADAAPRYARVFRTILRRIRE